MPVPCERPWQPAVAAAVLGSSRRSLFSYVRSLFSFSVFVRSFAAYRPSASFCPVMRNLSGNASVRGLGVLLLVSFTSSSCRHHLFELLSPLRTAITSSSYRHVFELSFTYSPLCDRCHLLLSNITKATSTL